MIDKPLRKPERIEIDIHPLIQLVLIFVFVGICGIIGYFIADGIISTLYGAKTSADILTFNTENPHIINALWILQIASTTIPLFVAPLFFAKYIVRDTPEYLRANKKFPSILLMFVFGIMLFSPPVLEVLSNINQQLALPASMKNFENLLRSMEQSAQKATDAMLQMKTIGDVLWAVFVVALLTAIAEEFLFRGCIQTMMLRWTKNPHAAIWITAILFSAFHMEFFTFLPRVALGVFFGYFVMWSGSIWTSVWAHFLNNATAVVSVYLYEHKKISIDPNDQHVFNYQSYALSLIIILILLFMYRNIAKGKSLLLS
jgi:membrane protease YdiL (CAAX protease family)